MFVDFLEDVEVLGLGVSDVDDDFFQVFVVYYCVVKEFSEFVVFLVRNFLQRIEESWVMIKSIAKTILNFVGGIISAKDSSIFSVCFYTVVKLFYLLYQHSHIIIEFVFLLKI